MKQAKQSSIWQRFLKGSFPYTAAAILVGFGVGALALLSAGYDAGIAYGSMFRVIFSSPKSLSYSFIEYSTPYILTGLSVAFSFKTGIFNIGAEGQYIVGSIAALLVGAFVPLPGWLLVPLCLIAAMAAGALWAGLVGFLKVRFGSHEVLCMIMFNWIAYYLNNYIVRLSGINAGGGKTWTVSVLPQAKIGITGWFPDVTLSSSAHFGIVLAVLCAVIAWVIISRTTLGFRLKAVGINRNAAEFAGINANGCVIASLGISGALAGLAGGLQVLGVTGKLTQLAAMESYGFNGITVALIGACNPFGTLAAGWFFGAMKFAGTRMVGADNVRVPKEIIDIMMGCIVFMIAASNLVKVAVVRKLQSKGGKPRHE